MTGLATESRHSHADQGQCVEAVVSLLADLGGLPSVGCVLFRGWLCGGAPFIA